MPSRYFKITWPDENGPMWMNEDNLMIALKEGCNTEGMSVEDITDMVPNDEELDNVSLNCRKCGTEFQEYGENSGMTTSHMITVFGCPKCRSVI